MLLLSALSGLAMSVANPAARFSGLGRHRNFNKHIYRYHLPRRQLFTFRGGSSDPASYDPPPQPRRANLHLLACSSQLPRSTVAAATSQSPQQAVLTARRWFESEAAYHTVADETLQGLQDAVEHELESLDAEGAMEDYGNIMIGTMGSMSDERNWGRVYDTLTRRPSANTISRWLSKIALSKDGAI